MKKQEVLNDIKRSDVANCIILHDFTIEKPDLKKWTEYIISFFRAYNIEPSKISSPSKTNNKLIDFKRGLLNHEKINYEVTAIEIDALPLNYGTMMFDAIFSATIDIEERSKCFTSLIFDSEIVKFDDEIMNNIALDLIELTGARYGYMFQREFSKVVGYEWGACSGLEYGHPEREFISKWSDEYRMPDGSYKTGDLRDIYPINILSKAHMQRQIFPDTTFEDWIKSSSEHGDLKKLKNNLWSWHVPDKLISPVRESLRPTGMILCI